MLFIVYILIKYLSIFLKLSISNEIIDSQPNLEGLQNVTGSIYMIILKIVENQANIYSWLIVTYIAKNGSDKVKKLHNRLSGSDVNPISKGNNS